MEGDEQTGRVYYGDVLGDLEGCCIGNGARYDGLRLGGGDDMALRRCGAKAVCGVHGCGRGEGEEAECCAQDGGEETHLVCGCEVVKTGFVYSSSSR